MIELKENFHNYTDVLVIGGGPSGLAAAVCAARSGVKVLLAEAAGCLGGMATSGLVGPFMTCYDSAGKHQIIKGFYEELMVRLEKEGVELLYNASLIDVICKDNIVAGGVFGVRGGVGIIEAKVLIDCTGNGDAAYLSGVPMEKPEQVQPASLFFTVDGVDKQVFEEYKTTHPVQKGKPNALLYEELIAKLKSEGVYSIPKGNVALYESCDGTWRVNMSRKNDVDATDPFETTQAAIELRRQIPVIVNMLRTYIPACKNIKVTATADQAGFRESRRIVGDFVLNAEDMERSVIYEDNIALCANSIDMHVGETVRYIMAPEKPYGIPYRSLLPQKIENMIVAGRCISCTRDVLAAIRVMPPCFAMGQAAGIAAAIAIEDNCMPKDIDTVKLQQRLRLGGAVLTYDDIR